MPADAIPLQPVDVVLAAGASRRFGGPKLLARCGDRTLLQRAVDAGRDAGLARSVLVFGTFDRARYDAAVAAQAAFTINAAWRDGQAGSVVAAVAAVGEDAPAVLLRTVDQVLVDGTALQQLIDTWRDAPGSIVAASYADTLGVPAIFPARCFDALRALSGDRGARRLIAADADAVGVYLPEAAVDVDTRDDLVRAEQLLLRHARAARSARS